MKREGKCVHYNGTINECCEAGVNYKELAGPGEAYGTRLPCWGQGSIMGTSPEVVTCTLRKLPTAEELAAEEAWLAERYEKMAKARAAIVAHLGGPWHKTKNRTGGAGDIDCPACGGKGTLRFSRAASNGHVHARCSTPGGCVNWME